ncbi:MAG TPA: class I SAM-dependent rRNA methyltransferase, partial [Treponema sp.]|nr:class I SAM-dependent rRNA methyltransferase [Treponema sp.]
MNEFPRVLLKAKEEHEIAQGFPWVFDNEIASIKWLASDGSGVKNTPLADCPVQDGSTVEVCAHSGAFLGSGILNRRSRIAVRMIGSAHADQIMADTKAYWSKLVRNAV